MEIKETSHIKLATCFCGTEESVIEFVNHLTNIIGRNAFSVKRDSIISFNVECLVTKNEAKKLNNKGHF
jgi:hypothetical protein